MRGSALIVSVALVVATAGCFGADVHLPPPPSEWTSGSPATPTWNEPPVSSLRILNASGLASARHFTGENVTMEASGSYDPDGRIVNHTWRILRHGQFADQAETHYGPNLTLRFDAPGDRTVVLQVRDDRGESSTDYASFGVHQHRIESGTLLLTQAPNAPVSGPVAVPVGAKNVSLPVVAGALLLSINATFPSDPSTLVRLEIRAPNGTILNHSEGAKAPLWAVATPQVGVAGNYTAHMSLVAGVAAEYRFEFVAWYGYG